MTIIAAPLPLRPGEGRLRYLQENIPGLIAFARVLASGEPNATPHGSEHRTPQTGERFAASAAAHLAHK